MIITSIKSHSITFTYYANSGSLKKVHIKPGKNDIDDDDWKTVKKEYKERQAYFKGLKENK